MTFSKFLGANRVRRYYSEIVYLAAKGASLPASGIPVVAVDVLVERRLTVKLFETSQAIDGAVCLVF